MSLKVSIHQPEYLPWLSLFDKIDQVDKFVLLDTVQFEKGYFQNRCKIRDGKGSYQLITLPLQKAKFDALICERTIDNQSKLLKKQINVIIEMYRKAPFFDQYFSQIEDLILSQSNLANLNSRLIQMISSMLGIKTEILTSSSLGLPHLCGGTEVNLAICKALGAKFYLSGKMGRAYLDTTKFKEADVLVGYHEFEVIPYSQAGERQFIGFLSVIDALFNCGEATLEVIRNGRRKYEVDQPE